MKDWKPKDCATCGVTFKPTSGSQRHCAQHKNKHQRTDPSRDRRYGARDEYFQPRMCGGCGLEYQPLTGNQRFCAACLDSTSENTRQRAVLRKATRLAAKPVRSNHIFHAHSAPRHVELTREIRVARATGFFDGEGCVSISCSDKRHGSYFQLDVSAFQTVRRPLDELVALFGGHVRRRPDGWRWCIAASRAAPALVEMLPYLQVKQNQARLAIEFQTLTRDTTWRRSEDLKEFEVACFWNLRLLRKEAEDYR